jgi:FkbM family methyltransferase
MIYKILIFIKRSSIGRFFLNKRIAGIHYGVARGFKRRGGIGILGLFLKGENREEQFMRSLSLSNKVIYDIGANFGEFSMFFSKASAPNGHVVSFDPLQQNCDAIADNLAINGISNVRIVRMGVGSKKETKSFLVDPDATQLASSNEDIKKAARRNRHSREVTMEIDSLDAIVAREKLPPPDLVKIDVEGMEIEVLQGMTDLMKTGKPALFIEVHGANIDAAGTEGGTPSLKNIRGLFDILSAHGYAVTHVESSAKIHQGNLELARAGHIYCA